jgi:hypothetical protein
MRDNLDSDRPDHVPLGVERLNPKRTPGRFRTRVVTEGVTPSLHIDSKGCRIKQDHQEARVLRTETMSHNTVDIKIGKRRPKLPALREVGCPANRRLWDVQPLSHDGALSAVVFRPVPEPLAVPGQRAARGARRTRACWFSSAPCWSFVCGPGVVPTPNDGSMGLPCWANLPVHGPRGAGGTNSGACGGRG